MVAGKDLKKEAAVIVDPVWSRPTLEDDSTEVQLLLVELPAGMISGKEELCEWEISLWSGLKCRRARSRCCR